MAVILFFVLSFSFLSRSSSDPTSMDEAALLDFKKAASLSAPSAASILLSGWIVSATVHSHCEWPGVDCDAASRRVTTLNIVGSPSARLSGTLPSAIGDLTELRNLSLPGNDLFGEIPATVLARLRRLEVIDLRGNNFTGRIPGEISLLPSLSILDLSYNDLSGAIPESLIGSLKLEAIDLSFNQLSGKISISPGNSSCLYLARLKLSGNLLVDTIPPEIRNCLKMQTLLLDRNILEGRMPPELGCLPELQILDVSRNSLTGKIPKELGNCRKLSVLVLTNLFSFNFSSTPEEFNAFVGSIPSEILAVPSLEILWAPRANLDGRLPDDRNSSCPLRILNLGQNYISGVIPQWLGLCENLSFLDLSSNYLHGSLSASFKHGCMVYFNVSRNSLSGPLEGFSDMACLQNLIRGSKHGESLDVENLPAAYFSSLLQSVQKNNMFESVLGNGFTVLHDFSWNDFTGSLPPFDFQMDRGFYYGLSLNNNRMNGTLSSELFGPCRLGSGFAVNLSVNQIEGDTRMLSKCFLLKSFEAANNGLYGIIPPDIGNLRLLKLLDLRGNYLTGSISNKLRGFDTLQQLLLGGNNLTGGIPIEVDRLSSLIVLDLSRNFLAGTIPSTLANATNLEVLLLDHNKLSGVIPPSFSKLGKLTKLTKLDLSFNNLSGNIPPLAHPIDCKFLIGNSFLHQCPDPNAPSPSEAYSESDIRKWDHHRRSKLKSFTIAAVIFASIILSVLLVLIIALVSGKKKLVRLTSLRKKVVVTFADAPAELTYENVVKATGNFSIQNLIGTGGFGATYKGELVPGFLVAVKRLSIGRFQGLQQFDAEIRTLGRVRHKNLVTLIGYHMGEVDTFLIYNFLSGGNLETFIRNMSRRDVSWFEIQKIALDVAQALSYLHYSCVPRILHRDIKPSNILLDEKLNAYLSDFGLARLLEVTQTHATTDVAGTFGYVAPEYATTCRVSDKADVYSFGVVLLELMSGKRSLDPSFSEYGNGFTIVAWGRLLIQESRAAELFSQRLWEAGPQDKLVSLLKLALACTVESLTVRPSMKQVVVALKQLKN